MRTLWDLPRTTHRYIVEAVGGSHLSTNLISNRVKFYSRLKHNCKPAVRNLFILASNDICTITGASRRKLENTVFFLGMISHESNFDDIDAEAFKRQHKYATIPHEEFYRISVIYDLLRIRTQHSYFEDDQFTIDELNILINDICTS